MGFNTFEYSDKGPRKSNEDSIGINHHIDFTICCIADGVGGEKCGKMASSFAVDYFLSYSNNFNDDYHNLIIDIHDKLRSKQLLNSECNKMATTFSAVALNNTMLRGVHVGDSRVCVLRGNGIKQLTEEHTEANRFLKNGKITFDEFLNYPRKNVIDSAIGIHGEIKVQTFSFNLLAGDRIILTSDGVHDVVSKLELRDLSLSSPTLDFLGQSILKLLSKKKLTDNLSFILVETI